MTLRVLHCNFESLLLSKTLLLSYLFAQSTRNESRNSLLVKLYFCDSTACDSCQLMLAVWYLGVLSQIAFLQIVSRKVIVATLPEQKKMMIGISDQYWK